LLDRLILVCSRVVIRHCNAYNAASLACEAAFYQANTLKLSIFDYISFSMETMLESGLLDDMHEDVMHDLCDHIAERQNRKLSVSRNAVLVNAALGRQKEWLALQDIPTPRVRQPWRWKTAAQASKSPVLIATDITPVKTRHRKTVETPSPVTSPELQPTPSTTMGDDIFTMDDDVAPSSSGAVTPRVTRPMTPLDLLSAPRSSGPVWKSKAVEADR
jgi:hypothetical protein